MDSCLSTIAVGLWLFKKHIEKRRYLGDVSSYHDETLSKMVQGNF